MLRWFNTAGPSASATSATTAPRLLATTLTEPVATSAPDPHETHGLEHHYLLRIEKIVMHAKWKKALIAGGEFPRLPIDYGYRDSLNFWFADAKRPWPVGIPKGHGVTADAVLYQANRIDPAVTWEPAACAELAGVPRVFLKTVLSGCVDAAKAQGVSVITPGFLHTIRDKRAGERPSTLWAKIEAFFGVKPR